MSLYVAWAFGNLQQLVGTAMRVDDTTSLKQLGTRIKAANGALLNWVRQSKGDVLADLGSGGICVVEPEKAVGVAGLVDRLSEFFGSSMHIGLGLTAGESWQALRQAGEHGMPYVLYDPELDKEEEEKSLSKAEAGLDDFEDPGFDARHYMREALQQVKAQAPAFEQLKAQSPEAYKALQRVIAAMVIMGHEIAAMQAKTPAEVQKAEDEMYKTLGLPRPKKGLKGVSKLKVSYVKPEPVVGSLSGPQNLDKERKSTTVDPETGAPDKTKWHSLRSGIVIGRRGGLVPSRQPNQD